MVGKPYDVLAENEKTESMVLEHKNSIMCIFKVVKEYKESVTILTNFILHFWTKFNSVKDLTCRLKPHNVAEL